MNKDHCIFIGETMLDLFGLTRQSYIGKEKDVENGLGDHGVRKFDYETGRFNSIDALWEKYYGWSPYQYCMNNPIWAKDWDGREIHVYSEKISASTLSRGSNFFQGALASFFGPRHSFMQITTDKVNVIIELGGPVNGSKKGNPIVTHLKKGDDPANGRDSVEENKISEPKEKNEYEFENKILETFQDIQNNPGLLPDYNGKDGPNSNSFIQFLIESNGGKQDKIDGGYGQGNTGPFYKYKTKGAVKDGN